MAEEKTLRKKLLPELTEFSKVAGIPIEIILDRKDEIVQLEFKDLEKIGLLLEKGKAACNNCCNGMT